MTIQKMRNGFPIHTTISRQTPKPSKTSSLKYGKYAGKNGKRLSNSVVNVVGSVSSVPDDCEAYPAQTSDLVGETRSGLCDEVCPAASRRGKTLARTFFCRVRGSS